MARAILNFTHDLRIDDHLGLAEAAAHAEVIPVLVLDPLRAGRLRRSPRRAAYYCDAVRGLDAALRARGTRLVVRRGRAPAVLRALVRATGASAVVWSAAYDGAGARSDRDLQAALEEIGVRAGPVHDAPAVAPEESTAARESPGDGYRSFVPYYRLWRTFAPAPVTGPVRFARHELPSEPLPTSAELDSPVETLGGIDTVAVLGELERFLAGPALQYAIARNVPSNGPTSRLSAHLSFGVVGARTVVDATRRRAADPFLLAEERASLALFERALAQRDFFLQLAHYHPGVEDVPLQEKMRGFAFARTHPALDAWRAGRTGYPLVDAGMRELRATGWMHPRLRAIAASFLCFDLGVDWRVGRDEWDRRLIEDSPALAAANWQWVAGVGADLAAYPRIYNPLKQARRFDPTGAYVRRWIPELAGRPDSAVLDPHAASREAQLPLALFGDNAYPAPVVDHDVAGRAFLERYRRVTAGGRPSR